MRVAAGGRPGAALPSQSVVIAAWNGVRYLRRCLEALEAADPVPGLEIIVSRNFDDGAASLLAAEYPGVLDIGLPSSTNVPRLRLAGIDRASGTIVALTEDHAIPAPGWAAALRGAHAAGLGRIIGGPVDQAPAQAAVSWGVYLYDYGRYRPPCPGGSVGHLSGINVSYQRALLEACGSELTDGLHEARLHGALRSRGESLIMEPAAVVMQGKRHQLGPSLRSAFHLGRGYAAGRAVGKSLRWRAGFAAGSVALPIVLTSRTLAAVLPKGRDLGRVLAAIPVFATLTLEWSAGELAGYATGRGDSDARWR